jgi:hypothetical protein
MDSGPTGTQQGVYDVKSGSDRISLSGSAYKEW